MTPARPPAPDSGISERRRRPVRTVRVPQMEDADCGAACLVSVLARHGCRVPLREARERCGIGRDGVTATAVKRAAASYGLSATVRRVPVDRDSSGRIDLAQVARLAVPSMIYVDMRHFVVLEGVRRRRVRINDPAVGRIRLSGAEFCDRFSGIALVLERTSAFRRGGPRLLFPREACRRLRPFASWLLAGAVSGLVRALPAIVVSLLLRSFFTYALEFADPAWRVPVVTGIAVIAAFCMAAAAVQQCILAVVMAAMATRGGSGYLWRLLRLPGAFFHQRQVGGLVTRVQFNDGLAIVLAERLSSAVVDVLVLACYLSVLAFVDRLAAGLAAGLVAVNIITMRVLARVSAPAQQRHLFDEYRRDSIAFNGLAMVETLKAEGAENWFFARWAGLQARALCTMQRMARTSQLLMVVPTVMGTLSGALVLVVGGLQVMRGQVTVPALLAAQMLVTAALQPASNLVTIDSALQVAKAQTLMLDDALSAPVDPYLASPPHAPTRARRLEGRVELINVTFGYDRSRAPVVDGLNLTIEPGQRVAIVGTTGSGKSTIARLVAGALRPWSGEIRVDGVPRDGQPRDLLTCSLAYVEQQLRFFEGSARDNLTLWDPAMPPDRIRQALADARIEGVVAQRGGLDAEWVQEQARNLSGGEKQRMEIARALALNPSILVLDEATSALDAETEMNIDANIRSRGSTCLVIAHRLSTIRDCDLIVVLDGGRVVQRGGHDDLIRAGGLYQRLVEEAA